MTENWEKSMSNKIEISNLKTQLKLTTLLI